MSFTPVRPGEPIQAATINALGERLGAGERLAPVGAVDALDVTGGALLAVLKHRGLATFKLLEKPFKRTTDSIEDDVSSAASKPVWYGVDDNRYTPTDDERSEVLYDVVAIAEKAQAEDRCVAWFNAQSGRWEIVAIKPRFDCCSSQGGGPGPSNSSAGSSNVSSSEEPSSESSSSSSSRRSSSSSSSRSSSSSSLKSSGSSGSGSSTSSSSRSSSSSSRSMVASPCCSNGAPARIKVNFVPMCGAPGDSVTLDWQGNAAPYFGVIWRSNAPLACAGEPARGVLSDGGLHHVAAVFSCSGEGHFNLGMNFAPIDCGDSRTCSSCSFSGVLTSCDGFFYEGTHAEFGNGIGPDACFGCVAAPVYVAITGA